MLERVVADASMWPVDEVIVVLGADADAIEDACDLTQVSLVIDPEWAEGSASPLRAVAPPPRARLRARGAPHRFCPRA